MRAMASYMVSVVVEFFWKTDKAIGNVAALGFEINVQIMEFLAYWFGFMVLYLTKGLQKISDFVYFPNYFLTLPKMFLCLYLTFRFVQNCL